MNQLAIRLGRGRALDGATRSVRRGERRPIVGASGSTLLAGVASLAVGAAIVRYASRLPASALLRDDG